MNMYNVIICSYKAVFLKHFSLCFSSIAKIVGTKQNFKFIK